MCSIGVQRTLRQGGSGRWPGGLVFAPQGGGWVNFKGSEGGLGIP